MEKTLDYYNKNAAEFVAGTVHVDFVSMQDKFLEQLPEKALILDFGCGSGRDTRYFLEQGFQVEALDGSHELCKIASEYTGITVRNAYFHELDEIEKYDGIWACASILHVSKQELPEVLQKMSDAVKNGGILYVSFKYGDFEGERNGRYFTHLTFKAARELLQSVPELQIEKQWITADARVERKDEQWLNIILKKKKRLQ